MKLLLDTTYLLPTIKVQVTGISSDILKDLIHNSQLTLIYSDISLFEVTAKGMKLIVSGETLTVDDIRTGIDILQYHSKIQAISWINNPVLLNLALSLRKVHSDFIDCIILASAICHAECVATYDRTFYNAILKHPGLIQEILQANSGFKFWFSDLSVAPVILK